MVGADDTGASPEEPVETRRRDKRPLDLLDPELKFEDVRPVSVEDLEQARRELDAATRELFRKISYPRRALEYAVSKLGLPAVVAFLIQEYGNEKFRDALQSQVVRKARIRLRHHTLPSRVGFVRFCRANGAATDTEVARWIAAALRQTARTGTIRKAIGNARRQLRDDPEADSVADFIAGLMEEERAKAERSAHEQLRRHHRWLSTVF
jgi:hypothetical protein